MNSASLSDMSQTKVCNEFTMCSYSYVYVILVKEEEKEILQENLIPCIVARNNVQVPRPYLVAVEGVLSIATR